MKPWGILIWLALHLCVGCSSEGSSADDGRDRQDAQAQINDLAPDAVVLDTGTVEAADATATSMDAGVGGGQDATASDVTASDVTASDVTDSDATTSLSDALPSTDAASSDGELVPEDASSDASQGGADADASIDADAGTGPGEPGFALSDDGFVVRRSDGERLLPLGLWNTPDEVLDEIRLNGHTFAARFDADANSDGPWLDRLASKGLLGMTGIDVYQVEDLSNAQARNFARNYVDAIAGRPKPLAYLAPDEGLVLGLSVSKLVAVTNGIKDADPNALVVYDDYIEENATRAKPSYDIFCWDSYPIGASGEGDLQGWRGQLRNVVGRTSPKAFWLAFQGWVMPPEWQEPTAEELRVMAFLGFINGATALLTFAYDYGPYGTGIASYPTLWSNYKALFTELAQLTPVLTRRRSEIEVTTSRNGIDAVLRTGPNANTWYLVAANYLRGSRVSNGHYSGAAVNGVVFAFDGALASASGTVRVISGGSQTFQLSDGEFTDDFSPYAAKVYEIIQQ